MNRHQTHNYLFCLWQPSRIQRDFFQATKIFTCIHKYFRYGLNSQSLPKYLYPDIVQAEQEFCCIPCSYMCSPWALFNKYTSNSEERVWNIGVITSSSSKGTFAHSTSSRGDVLPVDGSILSHCPDGKVIPQVFAFWWWGGGKGLNDKTHLWHQEDKTWDFSKVVLY